MRLINEIRPSFYCQLSKLGPLGGAGSACGQICHQPSRQAALKSELMAFADTSMVLWSWDLSAFFLQKCRVSSMDLIPVSHKFDKQAAFLHGSRPDSISDVCSIMYSEYACMNFIRLALSSRNVNYTLFDLTFLSHYENFKALLRKAP